MPKIIVNPDIHGRKFWKRTCERLNECERVIFLGDYLDPYDFENISVENAIENFKEIIKFKKDNPDKVVLLLGNHDLPYYSRDYYLSSRYHSRHSKMHHEEISNLFEENADLFKLAHVEDNVLFTHAGVQDAWVQYSFGDDMGRVEELCDAINELIKEPVNVSRLFIVTECRGGYDGFGSCVWSDVRDMASDGKDIMSKLKFKQIFGHTLQAFYDKNGNIAYSDKPIEFDDCKMLDNTKPYTLDTESFEAYAIGDKI